MKPSSLRRAARRVAARLDYARRSLLQIAYAEIDRGAAGWHAGRYARATVRVALGLVLYVLSGGQYAWASPKTWLCGRQSENVRSALWYARQQPRHEKR